MEFQLTRDVDLAVMDSAGVSSERLWKRWNIVPLVSLEVIRLHAGQVTRLVPSSDHVKVFIETTRKETGPPEEQTPRHVFTTIIKNFSKEAVQFLPFTPFTFPAWEAAGSSCWISGRIGLQN